MILKDITLTLINLAMLPSILWNITHRMQHLLQSSVAENVICIWWRHEMEKFSALLVLCEGKPSVTGGFPPQRPVTQNFRVFFDLRLNEGLGKQSGRRSFEKPSRSLWRQCNIPTSLVWYNTYMNMLLRSSREWRKWMMASWHEDNVCPMCHIGFICQLIHQASLESSPQNRYYW